MTNENRAEYGRLAIERGTPDCGRNGDDLEGLRTDASDAIANILHRLASLAESEMGVEQAADFARSALATAEMHFNGEWVPDDLEFRGDPRDSEESN